LTQSAVDPVATQRVGGLQVWAATHIVRSGLQLSTPVLSMLQRDAPASHAGAVHIAVDGLQSAAVAQGVPLCHVPATHVCGTMPTHCVLGGTHSPPHCPLLQMNGHCIPLTHCPLALHVCGVRLSLAHCALGGLQTPQMPAPTQNMGHAMPSLTYLPVASQT
jgi:hypothetical protein